MPPARGLVPKPGASRGRTQTRGFKSVAQVVAGVATGLSLQIVLVVVLRSGERARGSDFGDDGAPPLARLFDLGLDRGCSLFLRRRGEEDGGPVLGSSVVALAVECGGVVHAKKPVLQQIL